MPRRLRLVLTAVLALLLAIPTAASARVLAGTRAANDAVRPLPAVLAAEGLAVDGIDRGIVLAMVRAGILLPQRPGAVGDDVRVRPSDRPTDRPSERPSERPGDRPSDRPTSDEPVRTETFPVGQIGAVTLAWNSTHVRVEDVRFEEGWRHRVHQRSRTAVVVGFTNGESCGAFTAHLREGELQTDVQRRDCEQDTRTETFPVGDIGAVEVTYTAARLKVTDVRVADGWRHRIHQEHPNRAAVGFTDGETCVVFTVRLTDTGLETDTERHACEARDTDRPKDRPDDRPQRPDDRPDDRADDPAAEDDRGDDADQ